MFSEAHFGCAIGTGLSGIKEEEGTPVRRSPKSQDKTRQWPRLDRDIKGQI